MRGIVNYSKKLLFVVSLFFVSSCGYNTKNWPRISFEFESKDVEKITISFIKNSDKIEEKNNNQIIVEKENINKTIECLVGIPYKDDLETQINRDEYLLKLDITFSFKLSSLDDYKIVFYEYGVSNSKVVFNNGDVHFLIADIEGIFFEIKGE